MTGHAVSASPRAAARWSRQTCWARACISLADTGSTIIDGKRIWLVASENGALKGGKVGGIADVIRDLPVALTAAGCRVTVFTPAYGIFHRLEGARYLRKFCIDFAGRRHFARAYALQQPGSAVEHLFFEHARLRPLGPGHIYCQNENEGPYETDASRFAFFCAAMAAWVESCEQLPDVLHLHDWHTGLIPALRLFNPECRRLRQVRTVFTIHNLAYQGVRPLTGHASSLEAWFPGVDFQSERVGDPGTPGLVNFMATAIRLADKLNTVSQAYAEEILQPSDKALGFSGGEGLENELRAAAEQGRLTGILNGCAYPGPTPSKPSWEGLLRAIAAEPELLLHKDAALRALQTRFPHRPRHLLTSIGRVSAQKVSLLLEPTASHDTALEAILAQLGDEGVFIMLGSGEARLERRLTAIAAEHDHFLYLKGYSEHLPDQLYEAGDLFLMPSSFEPCGISQMLAMRSGQPCVVHAVGGLRDTIADGVNGFAFDGRTPAEQAAQFVATVQRALVSKSEHQAQWEALRERARACRFDWKASAEAYISELYELRR